MEISGAAAKTAGMATKTTCKLAVSSGEIMRQFIRENPGMFALYILMLALIPLVDIGIPHMVGKLIKSYRIDKQRLSQYLIVIVALVVLGQLGHVLSNSLDVALLPRMVQLVRSHIVQYLFTLQSKNYTEIKTGETITKLIRLPMTFYGLVEQFKNNWMPEIVLVVAGVIYLLLVHPLIGFISLVCALIVFYICYITLFQCESVSSHRDKTFGDTIEETDDVLQNAISVINANQQTAELERIRRRHDDYVDASNAAFRCSLKPRFMMLPILMGVFTVYLVASYVSIQSQRLTMASFVVVLLIVIQILMSLFKMLGFLSDTVLRWGILRHSMKLFESCQENGAAPTAPGAANATVKPSPSVPMKGLVLWNVSYTYRGDQGVRPVFHQLSMHLPETGCTLIEGKIGAGKSTMLKLLTKFLTPDSGEIYINGMPYSALSSADLHQLLGYVPQTPILFNRTVYENIVYGAESPPSKASVEERLRELGLGKWIASMNRGLDTSVGRNGQHISGGQRQIVWFLRVLFQETPYILLDEPTAAMDERTKTLVFKLIEKNKDKHGIIVVSHDPAMRRYADHRWKVGSS
jgi:ABC-type multidrug transport system fused ATPase/permease subunit